MSDFVLDASLALLWFLEDEADRKYSLSVLESLSEKHALVPLLWFYEVGNGLLMAYRRKRISLDQIDGFVTRLRALLARSRWELPEATIVGIPVVMPISKSVEGKSRCLQAPPRHTWESIRAVADHSQEVRN